MASACGWTCPDETVPTADAAPADAAADWLRCGGRALFGGLAMLFVYAVEDQFFVTTLRAEVDRQRLHRSTHGAWAAPALPFISLYAQGQGLPADLARPTMRM